MYLPEDHRQMFDILTELRIFAAANRLTELAEQLDDALVLLVREHAAAAGGKPVPVAHDV